MNDEYSIESPEVTLGDDGVYRWLYRMDMSENQSMLYMLMKIFAWICAGCYMIWVFLLMKGHDTEILPKSTFIFLLVTATVECLVWLGFQIARKVMNNNYDLRFEMDENKIILYQSRENMERRKHISSGRPQASDIYSEAAFNTVLSINAHPEWDMIDLVVIGGKFQVYVRKKDFDTVLNFIQDHVPSRLQK